MMNPQQLRTVASIGSIRFLYSKRVVGYSIDTRMKTRLAVAAMNKAVALRGHVAGCLLHSDRGSQYWSGKFVPALGRHRITGSIVRVGAAGDNAAMTRPWSPSSACCRTTPSPPAVGHP